MNEPVSKASTHAPHRSDTDPEEANTLKNRPGFDYRQYWEGVYRGGGNSGAGSYGLLAKYKAEIINRFILEHDNIATVIEFGCGDGHQLGLLHCPSYTGFDIANAAVARCAARYATDPTKRFFPYDPDSFTDRHGSLQADLVLSLDVLYHITDDDDFERSLDQIFASAKQYVILYTKVTAESEEQVVETIRDRDILKRLLRYDFTITDRLPQPHPTRSSASFILLARNR